MWHVHSIVFALYFTIELYFTKGRVHAYEMICTRRVLQKVASTFQNEGSMKEKSKPVTVEAFVVDDFYDRLGISSEASVLEIKVAYRQRALQCHPDIAASGSRNVYEKAFRAVTEAYQCLCNATERQRYNAKRKKSYRSPKTDDRADGVTESKKKQASPNITAEDINQYPHESRWNRYNHHKYFRSTYTKSENSRTQTNSDTRRARSDVHIRMTKGRSETIFRRAFMGRKVEHIILDMHQALKKGREGVVESMYDINASDLRQRIHEAILHFRCQEKSMRAPFQDNPSHKSAQARQPRKISFVPPYNVRIPRGTIIPHVTPTQFVHPREILRVDKGDQLTEILCESKQISRMADQNVTNGLLRTRYTLTEGGVLPLYEDTRDYALHFSLARVHANWTTGQGMLYSYHRPM